MSVQGIGPSTPKTPVNELPPQVLARKQAETEKPDKSAEQKAPEEAKQRGVIRLLQEGHFKGVADLRLRINFADELAEVEKANVGAVLEEAAPGFVDDVNAAIDDFVAGLELTEEQATAVASARETLSEALDTAVAGFQETETLDVSALVDQLQGAFNDFLSALEATLAPPAPVEDPALLDDEGVLTATEPVETPVVEVPVEEAVEEPVAEPAPALTAALGEALNALVSELEETLGGAALPELSEPSGKGVAYEKFLATYNELRGATAAEEAGAVENPLDTTI